MTNRNTSSSEQPHGASDGLHCEQCGGSEQLALIFKRLLCRYCALAFIQALRKKEMDHASQTR